MGVQSRLAEFYSRYALEGAEKISADALNGLADDAFAESQKWAAPDLGFFKGVALFLPSTQRDPLISRSYHYYSGLASQWKAHQSPVMAAMFQLSSVPQSHRISLGAFVKDVLNMDRPDIAIDVTKLLCENDMRCSQLAVHIFESLERRPLSLKRMTPELMGDLLLMITAPERGAFVKRAYDVCQSRRVDNPREWHSKITASYPVVEAMDSFHALRLKCGF